MSLQSKGTLGSFGIPIWKTWGNFGHFDVIPTNNHKVYYTKESGAPPNGLGCVSQMILGFL
jgi:hypothetical protein